jgi:glycosyltransferase involved in cell wall biosynthesis
LTDSLQRAAQPLVSVVIPVHNGERFLAEAIDSVLNQSFSAVELIAVDDASTDASAQVAHAYSPVRYVRREFHSTARARNEGAALAQGDYLAFLDQDDVWLADKLALQMSAFDSFPEVEAVFGEVMQFRDDPQSGPPVLAQMQGYAPSVMLIKMASFWRVGPFDPHLQLGEWVDWYARACDLKLSVRRLPQLVARRRLHSENKGVLQRAARVEYARVLKASLDRRRAARR